MSQVVEIKKPGDLWTIICLSGDTGLIHRRLIFVIYPKSGSLFLKSRLLKVPGLRTKHQQCIRQPFKMSLLLGVILSLMLSSVGKILFEDESLWLYWFVLSNAPRHEFPVHGEHCSGN